MNYLVATVKPWHVQAFHNFSPRLPGTWHLIESVDELTLDRLAGIAPRFIFFPHWQWRVPSEIIEAYECVCFHMTALPYGRGGSPLQNLILRGHKDTLLTALRMTDVLDGGPIYLQRPLSLAGTAQAIYERSAPLVYDIIADLVQHEPTPAPQTGEPCVFPRRNPEQSALPDTGTTDDLYDFIRMLDAESYPRAFIRHGQWQLDFSQAVPDSHGGLTAQVRFHKAWSGEAE